MTEYRIARVTSPDWASIPSVSLTHTGWLPPCPISASAQLCHNDDTLFLRMEAVETEIRATLSEPTDPVCEDSCLEFFFAPLADDSRYFNFEFNPLGNFYFGFGCEIPNRSRLLPLRSDQFDIRPFRTVTGWGITCQIPLTFLQLYVPGFSFSGAAHGNFYKCGDRTVVPHYLSWAKMSSQTPNYHVRRDFASLIFE